MPQSDPRPGEKYLHFKNKLYQIIAIAQHAETGEKMVVYQALYGTFQTYVLPWFIFVSSGDKQKYPQAQQKYCFQWVEFKKEEQELPREQKSEHSKRESVKHTAALPEPSKRESVKQTAALPEPSASKPAEQEEAATKPPRKELSTEQKMMAFFDADTSEERYDILLDMRGEVTDRMINNMAVVLDVVIEEGPLDIRYEELKACLRTRQRYERNRLK